MGLAQLNSKTWPHPKDVSTLAGHLMSQNATLDWARIRGWARLHADPDEHPPDGIEANHWGIDRALYGLIKNRRATLAYLEEVSLDLSVVTRVASSNRFVRLSEMPAWVQVAMRTPPTRTKTPKAPPPLRRGLCRHTMRRIAVLPLARLVRRFPNMLHVPFKSSPRALSSASRSRTADGNNSALRTLEVKALIAPTVSDMQINSVQPQHHEVCNKTRYL